MKNPKNLLATGLAPACSGLLALGLNSYGTVDLKLPVDLDSKEEPIHATT